MLRLCKMIENCITRGCSRLDSCCCLCSPVCGAWIEQPRCRGECRAMNSTSSAVVPRLILLEVRVTRNSCSVEDSCLLPLVIIPCRATGCCGISIFTAPTVNSPEFLSLVRLEMLEYRACDLPTVTFTTVCWLGATPSRRTIIVRPMCPVREHSKLAGLDFLRQVRLEWRFVISASSFSPLRVASSLVRWILATPNTIRRVRSPVTTLSSLGLSCGCGVEPAVASATEAAPFSTSSLLFTSGSKSYFLLPL